MSEAKAKIGIFGASGYTGGELVRLLLRHPRVEIKALTADRHAGEAMAKVFPSFAGIALPELVKLDAVDATALDLVFCALPHGTTQVVIKGLAEKFDKLKIVDLSADFRMSDPAAYEKWYGHAHQAVELQKEAVYGLCEIYRDKIRKARLVASPGCFTTTSILAIVPLIEAGAIDPDQIVIDSKSGMTGAGRAAKETMIFAEVSEGLHAYGVGHHRHMSEFDQEFSLAAKRPVIASFTAHLAPMNRGIYATHYVRTRAGQGRRNCIACSPIFTAASRSCRCFRSARCRSRASSAARTICRSAWSPTARRGKSSCSPRPTIWSRAPRARRSRT